MEALRDYVLGIAAAAMIAAITLCFAEKGPTEPLFKLICGLILAFSLVEPVLNMGSGNWEALGIDFGEEAKEAAEQGKLQADKTIRQLIKEETEAYILDKARELGLEIRAEIRLNDQPLPVPDFVTIHGTVPPYEKSILSRALSRELGIGKEAQEWIS